jgi:hypothetical protein
MLDFLPEAMDVDNVGVDHCGCDSGSKIGVPGQGTPAGPCEFNAQALGA